MSRTYRDTNREEQRQEETRQGLEQRNVRNRYADDFFSNPFTTTRSGSFFDSSFSLMDRMMRHSERMFESMDRQFHDWNRDRDWLTFEQNTEPQNLELNGTQQTNNDQTVNTGETSNTNSPQTNSYSRVYSSSSFTDHNGYTRSKVVRQVTRNGQTFREVVETDEDQQIVKRTGPESLLQETVEQPKQIQ